MRWERAAVQVGDEGHAARVVLEARVVEALLGGQHQLSIPERWIGVAGPELCGGTTLARCRVSDCTGHPGRGASRYASPATGWRAHGRSGCEWHEHGRGRGERGLRARPASCSGRPRRTRPASGPTPTATCASGSRRRSCSSPRPAGCSPWPRSSAAALAAGRRRPRRARARAAVGPRRPDVAIALDDVDDEPVRAGSLRTRSDLDSILATAVSNAIHRALPRRRLTGRPPARLARLSGPSVRWPLHDPTLTWGKTWLVP